MIIVRSDAINGDEMRLRLISRGADHFVISEHANLPFLIGYRRIPCRNSSQAMSAYQRAVEETKMELSGGIAS